MKSFAFAVLALCACTIPDRLLLTPAADAGRDASNADDAGGAGAGGLTDASADASPPDASLPEGTSPAFTLLVSEPRVDVVRGQSASVSVSVMASGGFVAPVSVSVTTLPTGVTVDSLEVPAGTAPGTLTFRADANAALGVDGRVTIEGAAGTLTAPPVTLPIIVQDASGTLDTTFGAGGVATVTIANGANSGIGQHGLAIQPDGRIAFAGVTQNNQLLVGRLTADGALDPGFATGGLYTFNALGYSLEVGAALVALPGGGLVVGGFGQMAGFDHAMLVAKFTDKGALDTGFGGTGTGLLSLTDGSSDAKVYGLALQPDGKLVIGGFRSGAAALARITSTTGAADPTFDPSSGGTGAVGVNTFPDAGSIVTDMALLPDGNILAPTEAAAFRAYRFTQTGAIDPSYGTDGGAATAPGSLGPGVNSLLLQPGGRTILIAGTTSTIELAGFNPGGAIDDSFGTGGRVSTSIAGSTTISASSAAMLQDGRFVVSALLATKAPITVLRYSTQGALDKTFGGVGYVGISAAGSNGTMPLAIDAAGRIVLATAQGSTVTLARFWP